jgi:hypothetical protein
MIILNLFFIVKALVLSSSLFESLVIFSYLVTDRDWARNRRALIV